MENNNLIKNKLTIEDRIGRYKNRMELLRTIIGVIVVCIQFIILYNLLTK